MILRQLSRRGQVALLTLATTTLATGLVASSTRGGGTQTDAQEGERIRAHVEFLADDLLEGREAGTRGFDVASRYAASILQVNGLEPAGDDGTYFEAVPLVESTLTQGSVTLTRDGSPSTTLENPADVAIMPNHVEDQVHLEAPVVFAGFGVTAPALDYDDYAGLDVGGKVVLTLSNGPARFPSEQRAHFGSFEMKLKNAADHGAVGMIVGALPDEYARTPWDRRASRYADPHITWVDAAGHPGTGDARLHAVAAVGPTGLEKLFTGSPVPLATMQAEATAGRSKGFAMPISVRIDTTTGHRRLASRNIIGRLRGRDAALADTYVALTAHLDHIGIGKPVNGDSLNNGAYDNATGSAILLEVARQLAAGPRPRRSILIVFVTAEEKGLIGSDYFARHPVVPIGQIVADVNLDMPVLMWPLADVIAWGAENSSLGAIVDRVTADNGLKVSPDPMPEENIFVRSDQYSFVKEGVPSVYLMPGFTSADPAINAKELFQKFLQTHYHQPSDDLALPMDRKAAGMFLRVNRQIIESIANDPHRPTWRPGNFFGDTFGHVHAAAPHTTSNR
jgi:hypothetical protein